jgi:hypothetical protein
MEARARSHDLIDASRTKARWLAAALSSRFARRRHVVPRQAVTREKAIDELPECRGWTIYRVWPMERFLNPEAELAKLAHQIEWRRGHRSEYRKPEGEAGIGGEGVAR